MDILTKWLGLSNKDKYTVEIDKYNNSIKIQNGTEKVVFSGHSDDGNMVYISSVEESYQTSIDVLKDTFIDAVKKASVAVSHDMTRPALNGVSFLFDDKTLSVA